MKEQIKIDLIDPEFERELFGRFDENIKIVEDNLSITIVLRDSNLVLIGHEKDIEDGKKLMKQLEALVEKGESLNRQNILYSIELLNRGKEGELSSLGDGMITVNAKGMPVKGKTIGQKKYVSTIQENTLTFGVGPAGTGKTYLAVAMAVKALRREDVSRIILTRPAVEAGEALGFLPGDLKDKVDPYLRPLYDALFDLLGVDRFNKYMEKGMIEVAPLAFMRGRTLDNAFIILDEAQNTTKSQMKMFLTRIGFGSKAVVTGDITQIDLQKKTDSGLVNACEILNDVPDVGMAFFTEIDVVRHELVQKIIKAYEKHEKREQYKYKNSQKK